MKAKNTKPVDHKQVADQIRGYLQDAVGDIAADMVSPHSGFIDKKWKAKIAKAKRNGCGDIQGWLADELYSDPDTLQDLMGDRIHDLVRGNEDDYQKVLDILNMNNGSALSRACEALKRQGRNAVRKEIATVNENAAAIKRQQKG